MKRNLGRFLVTEKRILDDNGKIWQLFSKLKFIPLGCQRHWDGKFEYMGISPKFEAIDEGAVIPVYAIAVHEMHNGDYVVDVVDSEHSDG